MRKNQIMINNLIQIIEFCRSISIRGILLWILLMIVTAFLTPILTLLYKYIIDMYSHPVGKRSILLIIIFIYVIIELLGEIIENVQNFIEVKINYIINDKVISIVNTKLNKIALEEYEKPVIYDLIQRIKENFSNQLFDNMRKMLYIVTPIITLCSYLGVLFSIGIIYCVISLITVLPYFYITYRKSKMVYLQKVELSKSKRILEYTNSVLLERPYAKEVRIFGLKKYLEEKANAIRDNIFDAELKLDIKYLLKGFYINILRYMALGICLVFSIIDYKKGGSIGDVMLILSVVQGIVSCVDTLITNFSGITDYTFYFKDFHTFLNLPEEKCGRENLETYDIVFADVCFKYPNSDGLVLDKVSLKINEGEKVAIVGKNGSGKSTFINLLLGMYQPYKGGVFIGNNKLQNVLVKFREKTVCVFQDFIKYQMTISDNIYAGNFGKENKEFLSGKYSFLFDNYNENKILGQLDEDGVDLSGGQWQKLAILRALYREDSKILILDEPTASIDPKTENEIYENFTKIGEGKTIILVSHRLSAAKLCDRIIVFEKGKVIEQGTHNELMRRKGIYFDMYTAQKELYQ